ncbi:hypothetical protein LTX14_000809 [Clostridium perfringens]|uniref:hypothetical protein n=1 Tax=Clostridium perfringens TaxID=1502 RepID=UPI0013E3DE04|nr:hypothetical protein [Clostridium perfringens]MBI6022844.1 hypothetical protein [Clostridium perfringens]MBI6043626.1 hypothetical protein [Clostridium perfringens]MBI6046046.1 hypothetical protein [Clostridium perfringens]MDJ8925861.1 hypothetical protein [Clostridium perfringens]MDJ8928702.1 hypothetical protein [Clostridium perfringens]
MEKFNANSLEVEQYVHTLASKKRIKSFYPQAISRKLNIPTDLVFIELTDLAKKGRIHLRYEIKCLEDLDTIKTVDNYKDMIGKKIFCTSCGKEIEINYNNIYPIFFIDHEYKEHIKKKIKD